MHILNSKAVVFKVQKTHDSQQVFALKIYKDSLVSDWNQCFHEERILKKITENNQMYAASGMTFQIAVEIICSVSFSLNNAIILLAFMILRCQH